MAQQKSDRDEFDGSEEVSRPFVVPGCKAAELFELVEEALHQVPLTIEPLAEGWFFSGVTARRNIRPREHVCSHPSRCPVNRGKIIIT